MKLTDDGLILDRGCPSAAVATVITRAEVYIGSEGHSLDDEADASCSGRT